MKVRDGLAPLAVWPGPVQIKKFARKGERTMGRKLFLAVLVAGLLAWGGSAQAAIMDSIYFYAVDNPSDGDNKVYLDINNITNDGWTLEYSYDNAQWIVLPSTSTLEVDTGSQGGFKKIYFHIIKNHETITKGDLQFTGLISGSLYHTAYIYWYLGQDNGFDISIKTAQDKDAVSPVPLPGSVLLLGSGLLGLALVYRRRKKSV